MTPRTSDTMTDFSQAEFGDSEFRREAIKCPTHGKTHVARFVVPKDGAHFAAHYMCNECAIPHLPQRQRKLYCDCGKAEYWCVSGCVMEPPQ